MKSNCSHTSWSENFVSKCIESAYFRWPKMTVWVLIVHNVQYQQADIKIYNLNNSDNFLCSWYTILQVINFQDKRYTLDSVEKSQHQKCLDTLQHCIKVTSLQSMVERLESLTRQLGLVLNNKIIVIWTNNRIRVSIINAKKLFIWAISISKLLTLLPQLLLFNNLMRCNINEQKGNIQLELYHVKNN